MLLTQIFNVTLSNGETLAYRKLGNGRRNVLMLHGNMSSSLHFKPILPFLQQDFTLYLPDMRGFGFSTYYSPVHSIDELAEDIIDFSNKLGLDSFALLGWSAGGAVAMQVAITMPQQVEGLILLASVGYMGVPIFDENKKPYTSVIGMMKDVGQLQPVLWAYSTHNSLFMNQLWDKTVYTNKKPNKMDNAMYIEASLQQRNLVDICWALSNFNLSDKFNGYVEGNGQIDSITAPALLLWGENDLIIPRKDVEATARALSSPRQLVILPECGHSPLVDCPHLLANKVSQFLSNSRSL